MKGLLRRLLNILPWITFLAALLYIFSLNFRPGTQMDYFQRGILEIVAPVSKSFQLTVRGVKGVYDAYLALRKTHEENAQLRQEITRLQTQLTEYHEAYLENLRLRRLLDFKNAVKAEAIPAQVVVHDPSGWFQTLIVDKGSLDGVGEDMPVVNDEGVVGRVMDVSERYARVVLITDPASAIDGMIERNRMRGVLAGKDASSCYLKYVRGNFDIQMGDLIITSGKDGVFPKGLRLGRVKGVRKDPVALFQIIEVEPTVRLGAIEEVLVLKRMIDLPKE
ncbi:MAG TPA: rod shape-determining protein MreC [Syntrophobacteraceae bacterium]|jgi:rod shape-determining protein MreC|nr:rod shape-determining protein MreC [Syntrophobacteraceae bacterium]HBZ55688.1 rod shape-determining protein MreC [Syntrophobacteraceae bacterium]